MSIAKLYSRKSLNSNRLGWVVLAAAAVLGATTVRAQDVYVSDLYGSSISEYDLSGNAISQPLAGDSSLGNTFGMAVSGDDMYVANFSANSISEYDTQTGALVTTFGSGVGMNQPADMILSGDDLYVANVGTDALNGSVYEFNVTTDAMVGTGPLVSTGLNYPEYLALSGNDLYVSNWNSINEYNAATGALMSGYLIGPQENVRGIAVNGNTLYVVDADTGTVDEFNATTGQQMGQALIKGLDDPRQIAYLDGDLYVSDVGTDTITEYDATTGAKLSTISLGCESNPYDFTITGGDPSDPAPVPEPSTWAMLFAGLVCLCARLRLRAVQV